MKRRPAIVVLAALFGMTALGWTVVHRLDRTSGRIPDTSLVELKASAGIGAERPRLVFDEAKGLAAARVAELPAWTGSAAQLAAARERLNAQTPELFDGGSYIVDRRGRVVAFDAMNAPLAQQVRQGPHIEAAFSGTVSLSSILRDPLTRTDVVAVAAPLKDASGKVTGVLVSNMKVAGQLRSRLTGIPPDSYLLDPSMKRLDPGSEVAVQTPPAFLAKEAKQIGATGSGARRLRGASGSEVAVGSAPVSDGWIFLSIQDPAPSANEPVEKLMREVWVILGLLLAGGIACMILLLRALRRAEAKSETVKRSLLAITGHELRTPLSVIRGFGQTLVMRWEKISDDQRRSMVDTVYRQARNLEHLIERLLTGAQLEAGQLPAASPRRMNIAPLLVASVDQQRSMAPLHDLTIEVPETLEAVADAKAVERVMTHLLENAARFSPSGGTIWVRANATTKGVEISVEDEGVGLPSDIKSIFRKFSQSEDVDTRVHEEGGLGLGLFIATSHIEALGGSIRAERRTPRGSRFVVTLKK